MPRSQPISTKRDDTLVSIVIWWFLEMGVPPVIIHFNRLFPKINHLFGILHPHLWKPPYVESPFRFDDSILDPFVISLENPPANRPMIFSSLRPFKASNYRGFSLLKPPWRISQPFSKPFPSVIFQPATNSAQSRSHQVNGRTCWMKRTFLWLIQDDDIACISLYIYIYIHIYICV